MKKFTTKALKHIISRWNLGYRYIGSYGEQLRKDIKVFCDKDENKHLEGMALAEKLFNDAQIKRNYMSTGALTDDLERLLVRAGVHPVVQLKPDYSSSAALGLGKKGYRHSVVTQLQSWKDIKEKFMHSVSRANRTLNLKTAVIKICEDANKGNDIIESTKSWLFYYVQSNADLYKRRLAFTALDKLVSGQPLDVEAFYRCCMKRDYFDVKDVETGRRIRVPQNKLGMLAIALAKVFDPKKFRSHIDNDYAVYQPTQEERKANCWCGSKRRSELPLPMATAVAVSDADVTCVAQAVVEVRPAIAECAVVQREPEKSNMSARLWNKLVCQMDAAAERVSTLDALPIVDAVVVPANEHEEEKTAVMCS
jgi:hypothetical protein